MRSFHAFTVWLLMSPLACTGPEVGGAAATGSTAASSSEQPPHPRRRLATRPGVDATAPHAKAAAESLDLISELTAHGEPMAKGFHSPEEVAAATLGQPLPMFIIGLDALRDYKPEKDPKGLLIDERSFLYTLTLGDEPRSAIVVGRRPDGSYEVSSFGHENLAATSHAGRSEVARSRGVKETDFTLVSIPALSVKLLGHEEHAVLMLTALHDITGTTVHRGDTASASQLLPLLQGLAPHANSSPASPAR